MTDKGKVGIAVALVVAFGIFVVVDQRNLQKAASAPQIGTEGGSAQIVQTNISNSPGSAPKLSLGEQERSRPSGGNTAASQGTRPSNPGSGVSEPNPRSGKPESARAGQNPDSAGGPSPSGTAQNSSLQVLPDGRKVYTVQQGDTLFGISIKVYNTPSYYEKLYEANQDKIEDPNTVRIGLKLTIPDLPSNPAAPASGTVTADSATPPAPASPPPAANPNSCQVMEGDSLWRIAERYALERKVSVTDMMKQIVQANPGKLKDLGTLLRAGWQLVIPEQPEPPKKSE